MNRPLSPHDPRAAAAAAMKEGDPPSLYMAVGDQDFLKELNYACRDYLQGIGYPLVFEGGEGGHEHKFCQDHVFRGVRLAMGKEA